MPWQRLRRFPEQRGTELRRGDAAVAALTELLRDLVDPEEVERSGRLPDGLTDALHKGGFLRLMADEETNGLALSPYNALRVIEVAAGWCMPVAFSLAITNGFGSGSYLPLLPEGPLRDMIEERYARGMVSAGADAEPIGTANERRATVAVPSQDGSYYEISGDKVFIGNGPIADLMDVSATLRAPDGTEEVRLFFVESSSPGFSVKARHEFMGLHGAEIGALRLDRVRVPAFHLMDESEDSWRMRPGERGEQTAGTGTADTAGATEPFRPADLGQLAALGRILVIGPASLAVTKMCLQWSRDFVGRRSVDGRGLGEYEEIQRQVAETAADVFTVDTVLTWALNSRGGDSQPELTAAKNLASSAAWRAVDRTVSLLGAEGYETAASKAARGARPLPVERCFRDTRALRIAGGVDFMVDRWAAEAALMSCFFTGARVPEPDTDAPAGSGATGPGSAKPLDPELSPMCRAHQRYLREGAAELARVCARLSRGTTPQELFGHQRTVAVVGRIGNELLSMALVLARAASLASAGEHQALRLADLSCAASRLRLTGLWPQVAEHSGSAGPDFAGVTNALLHGTELDFLLSDVITDSSAPHT